MFVLLCLSLNESQSFRIAVDIVLAVEYRNNFSNSFTSYLLV